MKNGIKRFHARFPVGCLIFGGVLLALGQVTVLPNGFLLPTKIFSWISWVGWVPFFFICDDLSLKRVWRLSFLTHFIYFALALYWLTIACAVFGGLSWPISFSILFFLAALLSFFMAPAALIAFSVHRKFSVPKIIALPTAWVAMEYARTHCLTGYPWLNIADSQSIGNPILVQLADLTGQNGITWIIIFVNVLIAQFILGKIKIWEWSLAGIIFLSTLSYGGFQLQKYKNTPPQNKDGIKIAALQANISQDLKWDASYLYTIVQRYIGLAKRAERDGVDLVVWPEAAFPGLLMRNLSVFPNIGEFKVHQLIGVPTQEKDYLYNTAFLLDPQLRILGGYDKTHLVPFGEYVPYKTIFSFMGKLVPAIADFVPGEKIYPLAFHNNGTAWNIGILLCYEDIFPNVSLEMARGGADLLVNLTNDGWYGSSSAAYQHLAISIFRAIETRLPLVRATNTGITAWIGPDGSVQEQLPWFEEGILYAQVPRIQFKPSFYVRYGDWFPQICLVLSVAGFVGWFVSTVQIRYTWRTSK